MRSSQARRSPVASFLLVEIAHVNFDVIEAARRQLRGASRPLLERCAVRFPVRAVAVVARDALQAADESLLAPPLRRRPAQIIARAFRLDAVQVPAAELTAFH